MFFTEKMGSLSIGRSLIHCPRDKAEQASRIDRIGSIYSSAFLTIVVANRDNLEYGFEGSTYVGTSKLLVIL